MVRGKVRNGMGTMSFLAVTAVMCVGAVAGSGCSRAAVRSLSPQSSASTAATAPAVPGWVANDGKLLSSRGADYAKAVDYVRRTGAGDRQWKHLSAPLKSLSQGGAVWVEWSADSPTATPDLIFFDTGQRDYSNVEGLVYSASGAAPSTDTVFGPVYAQAPHWWTAKWDPALAMSSSFVSPAAEMATDAGDVDAEFSSTDVRHLKASAQSIEGTVVTLQSSASYYCNLFWVDIGHGETVCVAVNKWTHFADPHDLLNSESTALALQNDVPTPLRMHAVIKTLRLPVNARQQSFAIEATITAR
jgi:hypothetical protein